MNSKLKEGKQNTCVLVEQLYQHQMNFHETSFTQSMTKKNINPVVTQFFNQNTTILTYTPWLSSNVS